MLSAAGAKPYVTYLPRTAGEKLGLDDLFVRLGLDPVRWTG
jgi:hypothetical protein